MPNDDFTSFCEAHYEHVLGTLTLHCRDRLLAEELTQEVFTRAFRDWTSVRRLDIPERWLYRVGFNLANSWFRRKLIERKIRPILEQRATLIQRSDAFETLETLDQLQQLDARSRAVVILRHYVGLTVPEVAEWLDIPEGTAKTAYRRAIRNLRLVNEGE